MQMNLFAKIARKFTTIPSTEYRLKSSNFLEFLAKNTKLNASQTRWNNRLNKADTRAPDEPDIDLQENFLHGFQKEDFINSSPVVKKALSLSHANDLQMLSFKKHTALKKFARDLDDTGSPEAQVACMTEQIIHNVNHCINNNKDCKAKWKLVVLMNKRMTMLNVLRRTNPNVYIWIVRDYNIQHSQKKLETFNNVQKKHKKGLANRKKFYGKHYNNVGFRPSDIWKEWNRNIVKERQLS